VVGQSTKKATHENFISPKNPKEKGSGRALIPQMESELFKTT
jgi:hypothetical protein